MQRKIFLALITASLLTFIVGCDEITHSVRVLNETNKTLIVSINGREYGKIESGNNSDYETFRKDNKLYGKKVFKVEIKHPDISFEFGDVQLGYQEYSGYVYSEGLHTGNTKYTLRVYEKKDGNLDIEFNKDVEDFKKPDGYDEYDD